MPSHITPTHLIELLAQGELVIVPGEFAGRNLRRAFDEEQRRQGRSVWRPPHVFTWEQWLQSLWSECIVSGTEDRLLLNRAQENSVWQEVVAGSEATHEGLLGTAISAELAASAWKLAGAWGIAEQLRRYATTHDARTFADWSEAFNRVCKRNGYVTRSQLETVLTEHIKQSHLPVPMVVYFAGFGDHPPAQERLLDALQRKGTAITHLQIAATQSPQAERFVLRAEGEEEEFHALAIWVRRFIEARSAAGLRSRVGVLLPDWESSRDSLESIFREVLSPELQWVGEDPSSAPYAFAGGRPLASHPMIAAALDLARWATGTLEIESVSALLLSPYVGATDGRDASAQFDALVLRQAPLLRPELDLSHVVRLAQRSAFGATPLKWLRSFQDFLKMSGNLLALRSYAEWTEFVRRFLRAANWPGAAASNAAEFQLARAWDHALDTVATLDFSGRRVPYETALHALERQLANTSAPQITGTLLVQVLRPEDAAGTAFDAVVFARATDTNWPPADRPHPLIDWRLQAGLRMPGADHARSAQRSRQFLDTMLMSAQSFVFSYAENDDEGRQRLTPVAAQLGWPAETAAGVLASVTAPEHIAAEIISNTTSLPPLPSREVHGGASVLKAQAACGFRAFAEVRLRAAEVEATDLGFDARERGNLLHRVMDSFWTEVRTQSALKQMSTEQRSSLLTRCIDAAFEKSARTISEWDQAYVMLQKQRLRHLLEQWMDFELARAPFEVLAVETTKELSVGPLDLHLRVDRMEHVENQDGVFLVDYKTGYSAKPQDWLGERPDEPQLPLYALLPEAERLAGVAFAKVRPGDSMEWLGYAAREGLLPGRNTVKDLPILVDDWRAHLTALAEAFATGDARVRPKEYPVTCAWCSQRLLCRLDPATLLAVSDPDEVLQEDTVDG